MHLNLSNQNSVTEYSKASLLEEAETEEIKEFHFHVYFFQDNEENKKSAIALRQKILDLVDLGFFHPVPFKEVNVRPIGPHAIGSYEVWCPKEHFSRVYSWFLINRGPFSVLVHPLTVDVLKDHTSRATWMGTSVPLDLSLLPTTLDHIPLQYPELGMGYSTRDEEK
ncbi:hypothetical protein G9A89_020891 [Geosiphon pyriformis]|nr:hypothetical protein G9A89_020891 [Geosiphon pyriformis]